MKRPSISKILSVPEESITVICCRIEFPVIDFTDDCGTSSMFLLFSMDEISSLSPPSLPPLKTF